MSENNKKLAMRLILSVDKDNALAKIEKAKTLTEELNCELMELKSMFSCQEEKMEDSKPEGLQNTIKE